MSTHFTLTLRCSSCGAEIVYEDERPDWQELRPIPALLEAAEAYVAEHPRGTFWESRPPYVWHDIFSGRNHVSAPEIRYYAICPACDGAAYRESGLGPEPVESPDVAPVDPTPA